MDPRPRQEEVGTSISVPRPHRKAVAFLRPLASEGERGERFRRYHPYFIQKSMMKGESAKAMATDMKEAATP